MALGVIQKVIMRVIDNDGTPGTLSLDVTAVGTDDPIEDFSGFYTAFNAVSDCIIVGQVGQTADNTPEGDSETNKYDIRDKLEVTYVGSQNDHHKIEIGDLDPAMLLADNEHVDPDNDEWMDLVDAIEANVVDKLGNAVTVTSGKRTRSRNLTRAVQPEAA